jgi:nucleotide-binding universal stress UspA family protein
MRLLIGYDGSPSIERALSDLAGAGLPAKAEAVVLCVATAWGHARALPEVSGRERPGYPLGKPYRHHLDQALKAARDTAGRGKGVLREVFRSWDIKAEGAIDDAAEAILRKAESWNADLIVVGSGRSAIGRLFLGSVSQKVVNYARTSVRIIRAGAKGKTRPPRVLIGMDGSPDSLAAVSAVCERNWPEGTAIRLAAAVDSRSLLSFLPVAASPQAKSLKSTTAERHWLEGKMELAMDRLAVAGLDVEPVILKGDPRRILLEQAEDWHARSIFVGSRGLNKVERFIIGSTSSTVAAHAPCSVEIIKRLKKRNP